MFASERQRLLDKIDQVEGTEELRMKGRQPCCCMGRRVEGMADQVVARVNNWVMEEVTKCWKRRKKLPPVHCITVHYGLAEQYSLSKKTPIL